MPCLKFSTMVILPLVWTILIIDDDLAGMYLTEKLRGKQRPLDQHDEVELLLEAYVKQIDGIVQEADQLVTNMSNTEDVVNIILDANRNSLMLLDLKVPSHKSPAKLTVIVGVYDYFRNWIRCPGGRSFRHELEEFHGRLGIWISRRKFSSVWDDSSCVCVWMDSSQANTKIDIVWT